MTGLVQTSSEATGSRYSSTLTLSRDSFETAYSRSGINQMWILKHSKALLDHLKSQNFNLITNIKSFDFSTLYTTIPHQKLKSRLATIIRNSFIHKNGNRRYKYLVLSRAGSYFVREHSDSKSKYTERRHHQDARVSSWQHFRGLRRKGFPTETIGISVQFYI